MHAVTTAGKDHMGYSGLVGINIVQLLAVIVITRNT